MAKKRYEVDILSQSSIAELQRQLKAYQNDLSRKCELVVKTLVDIGRPIVESNIAQAQITYGDKNIQSGADTSHNTTVKITSLKDYARADFVVDGKEIVFIEFGSGVYHNAPPGASSHPKGQEFGFVIGSYGQHKGVQKVWGYYADSGELILTHGVEATMPMYKAVQEMYKQAPNVVKKVFM